MQQITSISEFLLQAGTEYRVFDMGRTIRHVSTQAFLEMENAIKVPDYPRAGHAWFGLIFWNKQLSEQHYIWFIKLPLDEKGLIVPAARNHFLQIIVDALGNQLQHTERKNGQLPENPYTFVPNQQQLADFNSISRNQLRLGQSEFFSTALRYFENPMEENWQALPLQGLADVACQIGSKDITETIRRQFLAFPNQVKFSLLVSLENQPLPEAIAELICAWAKQQDSDPLVAQHALRSLAQTTSTGLVRDLLVHILNQDISTVQNVLAVISGRLWQHLEQTDLLQQYLERVAEADESGQLFAAIYTDIVQIPSLRENMLAMLRWTDKSPALTACVGKLFQGAGKA